MDNNDGFNVLVYPHADYAFIVALLMIVSEMKHYFDEMVYLAAGMAPLGVGERREGSRVHLPWEEDVRSRHQRLFEENV
ncbi:hypothetical protein glysoja_001164 [Glycine soja]|nr:hypothetical protein glysoja_001164 [Glycine soja]